jgi:hypothetical protein
MNKGPTEEAPNEAIADDGVGTINLGKNDPPVVLVGVLVSSLSLIHNGLEDPLLDGPGLAILE